jgi:hypothetical protein
VTLGLRKLVVAGILAGVFVLSNAVAIAHWLRSAGLVDLARWVRGEFITGTAVTVVVVLLWLFVERRHSSISPPTKPCRVCERVIAAGGRYCPHCGSRT